MKFCKAISRLRTGSIGFISSVFFLSLFFSSFSVTAEQETAPAPKVFDRVDQPDESNKELSAGASTEELAAGNNNDTPSQDNEVNSQSAEEDTRTTAEKLEDLKQEVLDVNRDLFILEEDLLFPASTQLAAYFSVDIGYFFSLDNIKIKIDNKQVTHHLYTDKDVKALYRGAIQKVYLGNISTGEHEIVAILIGIGPHKREYRRAVSFKFEKSAEAKAIEIQLRDDGGKLQPKLKVVEW